MSPVQEKIARRAYTLSNVDADYIWDLMERLFPEKQAKTSSDEEVQEDLSKKRKAFLRMEELSRKFTFPADFDPDKELAEARDEKYGSAPIKQKGMLRSIPYLISGIS